MAISRPIILTAWLIICGCSTPATETIKLSCDELSESSGIAVSTRNREIVWSHNDSGDKPRLFAFTRQGKWIAEVELKGARASDWEDMCSFERDGKHFLAIGDVGDNLSSRPSIEVYVVDEPEIDLNASKPIKKSLAVSRCIEVKYANGPVNCESLAYDPLEDQFLLVSKESLRCLLMTFPAQPESNGVVEPKVQQVLALPLTTAADISRDGRSLVIATYGPACLLTRGVGGRWDTSEKSLKMLELPMRRQGESICFDDDGRSLLLTSEFAPTPLWSVRIEQE